MFCNHFVQLITLLLIASACPSVCLNVRQTSNVVDLGYAKYQGFIDSATNNTQFLGVRFAAPPTGSNRWRTPQNPTVVSSIQQANVEGNVCFGTGAGSSPTNPFRVNQTTQQTNTLIKRAPATSEDCLFLNVFVPGQLGSKTNLPVVVWIHGGGYVGGSAADFNGNDLIREAGGGVVVVTIQYRLGIFGFLPGQKVKDQGALNAGLLDQQFALRWVQQHITKFGGDPQKVTIWGESAGAGSVLQHIIANGGRTNPPLFRGAITSSTFLPSQYNFNDRIPEQIFSEVVSQTNCTTAQDTIACLRAATANALQSANTRIAASGFFGLFVAVPVVDGTLITARATQILRSGKFNGNALLSVTNTFEGAAFVDQSTAATVQVSNYVAQLFPNFGAAEIAKATALYATTGFTPINQVIAIQGEAIFICPTYYLLRAFAGRSFKGEFAIPPGGHGQDVAYYFTSQNANGVPQFANPDFDKAFPESFLNFVLSQNPGIKWDPTNVTPQWNPWNGSTEMLFNKTAANAPDIRAIKTLPALLQRCDFWESVGALSGQ